MISVQWIIFKRKFSCKHPVSEQDVLTAEQEENNPIPLI